MMEEYAGKRLLRTQEFCRYVGLGKTKGIEWAKSIGAVKHIGKRLLFDRVIIDRAIDNNKDME